MSGSGQPSKVCVIGSEYWSSEMVELALVREDTPKPMKTILVSDTNSNTIFKIHDTVTDRGMHRKRLLLDPTGTPILSFRPKAMSLHSRWVAYKGSSENEKDLIFSAKQSKMMGSKRELNVFLSSNKEEKMCDFKVGSSYSDFIYVGDSHTNVIAEMKRKVSGYTVKVYPKVDQAFVIALIVILDGIKEQDIVNASLTMDAVSTLCLVV